MKRKMHCLALAGRWATLKAEGIVVHRRRFSGEETVGIEQAAQCQARKPCPRFPEKLAAMATASVFSS